MSDDYEDLSEKHDTINKTIDSVADISSATAPSFSNVTSNAEEAVKVITDLEEKHKYRRCLPNKGFASSD